MQDRAMGGLLGAGHSWVASPATLPTNDTEILAMPETTSMSPEHVFMAAKFRDTLYNLLDKIYIAIEDTRDALSTDVLRLRVSGSGLLATILCVIFAVVAMICSSRAFRNTRDH